jgi:hypothetical protein
MRFANFTEQDYLESRLSLVGNLNDIASLPFRKTRDFRIDEHPPIHQIDNKGSVSINPDHERRIKEHIKRIQTELRSQNRLTTYLL